MSMEKEDHWRIITFLLTGQSLGRKRKCNDDAKEPLSRLSKVQRVKGARCQTELDRVSP